MNVVASRRALLGELAALCSGVVRAARAPVPSDTLRSRLMDPGGAICDSAGRVVACQPLSHLGSFGAAARALASDPPPRFGPGDVVLLNDPFSGGSRVLDLHAFSMVRAADSDGLWMVAARGSCADLGGDCFGGYNPRATEVWAEGARVTPLRIFAGDTGPVRDVAACVELNSRTPHLLRAQLDAMTKAVRGGGRRLAELLAASDLDPRRASGVAREAVGAHWRDMLEARSGQPPARAASALAAGAGRGEGPTVRVEVRPAGGRMVIDLSGSDDADPGYRNATRATAVSAALAGAVAGMATDLPANDGMLEAFEPVTRPGALVDAGYPQATGCATLAVGMAVAVAVRTALDGAPPRWRGPQLLGEDGRLDEGLTRRLLDDEARARSATGR